MNRKLLHGSLIQAAIECLPATCAEDHSDRYSAGKGEIEMSSDTGKWQLAGEDKTFIYALGPGGTNTFFCHVQSAGPERASKAEKEAIAALMAGAPAMLDALKSLLDSIPSLTCESFHHAKKDQHDHDDECPPFERYLAEAIKARALIAKHRGVK